jgi:hypothetical protein
MLQCFYCEDVLDLLRRAREEAEESGDLYAINLLGRLEKTLDHQRRPEVVYADDVKDALDRGGTAEWVLDSDKMTVCSYCECQAPQQLFVSIPTFHADIRTDKTRYCPNCGRKMEKIIPSNHPQR